jgi:TonB family protein
MTQQICPKCQNVITNDSDQRLAFCSNCGASFQILPNEKATALNSVPMLGSPVSPNNYSSPKSNTVRYLFGCFGLLLLPILGIFGYWVWSGMGNPIAKFTNQYNCTIVGEAEPKTSDDYLKRAEKHMEINRGKSVSEIDDCAFGALNEALRLDRNNAKAFRLRAWGYRWEGKIDLALADYDRAIQIEPNNPMNYWGRFYLYEDQGKSDKALEELTTLLNLTLKNDSSSSEELRQIYEKRLEIYRKLQDYENAIKDASETVRQKPNSVLELVRRARIYEDKGDFESAVKDYTEVIRIEPNEANHYYLRSEAFRKWGKNDLADADIVKFNQLLVAKKGSKTNPNPPSAPNSSNTISDEVLNSKAINLVNPQYPPAAKAVRASGEVKVQVTVDENGNVSSARAISGHILLKSASESAARALKFKPTVRSGQKVKVTGVIVYIFAPQ